MPSTSEKRTAKVRTTLTKRFVEALQPAERSWIAWDDRLTGFGVRIHPAGTRTFIVNYRSGDGGRKAPNKRVSLGRYGPMTVEQARKRAQEILGKVASGNDPVEERAEARRMPSLGEAFEDYMAANPNRSKRTDELYRYEAKRYLGDWLVRPLDLIARRRRRGPLQRHHRRPRLVTGQPGAIAAAVGLPPALRRPGGFAQPGRSLARRRRQIPLQGVAQDFGAVGSAAVLAQGDRGRSQQPGDPGCTVVRALHRHAPRGGADPALRAGRHGRAHLPGRGDQDRRYPGTPDHAAARGDSRPAPGRRRGFARRCSGLGIPLAHHSATDHVQDPHHLYGPISKAGGAKFWFHGLRNCFITVAERELMLPPSLTKRLVNHAPPNDVTEGYAADWTVSQLREPAQRIADRTEVLMCPVA
ncbi:MAG: Arm DNA-binding domain-containing protein [Rhodospirillaceae bacterium]|nr:Arm DNA-binding domain-containing protein [Rhodospirillaceae bacterium]